MILESFFRWLQHTDLGTAIREGTSTFPWIESIHVLAITSVVGTIAIVDLRLMGLTSRDRPISEIMAEVLPFTRWAFALAVVTGLLLFTSHALDYTHKAPFIAKMILLAVALVNIVVFHRITARGIAAWDTSPKVPISVRFAGAGSLALWAAVVACGRWIGFV
jgi:hypothetical protein